MSSHYTLKEIQISNLIYLFIYLAASSLSCSMWDLLLWSEEDSIVVACGILDPQLEIQSAFPAFQGTLNHWTTREDHGSLILNPS